MNFEKISLKFDKIEKGVSLEGKSSHYKPSFSEHDPNVLSNFWSQSPQLMHLILFLIVSRVFRDWTSNFCTDMAALCRAKCRAFYNPHKITILVPSIPLTGALSFKRSRRDDEEAVPSPPGSRRSTGFATGPSTTAHSSAAGTSRSGCTRRPWRAGALCPPGPAADRSATPSSPSRRL